MRRGIYILTAREFVMIRVGGLAGLRFVDSTRRGSEIINRPLKGWPVLYQVVQSALVIAKIRMNVVSCAEISLIRTLFDLL